AVRDAGGNTVTSDATTQITMAIDAGTDPTGGAAGLSGTTTLTVTGGVATFSDLSIDSARTGYRLHATSSPVFTAETSNPFHITPGAADHLDILTQPSGAADGVAFTTQPV